MFYVLFFFSIYLAVCSGQYSTDIDTCIRNGVNVANGSYINQNDVYGSRCGFILQANSYAVVQPLLVNLNSDTEIKLFLLSGNRTSQSKTLIYDYYGRFLYKDLTLIVQGYQQFALVVLSRNYNNNMGQFRFAYRTNCFVELAAEDYPRFNSPNYYPQNPGLSDLLNHDNIYGQYCTYKIYSRNRKPFTVKFKIINYNGWSNIYMNGSRVTQNTLYTFSGESDVTVSLAYSNFINNTLGFSAAVEVALPLQLSSIDGSRSRGIPQLQFLGNTYNLQHGSLSYLDSHVLCMSLGYGGVDSISRTNSSRPLLFHNFRCTGPEKSLSQCTQVTTENAYYKYYYSNSLSATVINCSENFPIRLINGNDNSSGVVQVKLGTKWGYICTDNTDQNVGDVLCRELGFRGALEMNNTYYNGNVLGAVIRNIRCGFHKKLKNCHYETSTSYLEYLINHRANYDSNDSNFIEYRNFNDTSNYSQCRFGLLSLSCRNTIEFSLSPGHFEGFLKYNESFICDNSFAVQNAKVYCRYLGYPGARKTVYNGHLHWNRRSFVNLFCVGNENSPSDCHVSPTSYCPGNQVAGVVCQTVALAGSNNSNEGRVEVFYKGRRGLLCDDDFDINDGHVICRQLGFGFAGNAFQAAAYSYGYGNGLYLLDDLRCRGTEESIHECTHTPWGQHNCGGNEISGLVCVPINGYNETCGNASVSEGNSISSYGYNTTFGANPWQARLIPRTASEWCSATIINRNWLITSANCFTLPTDQFNITVGSWVHHWNSASWSYTNNIQSVFIHPLYSSVTGDYNIALVKVSTPITFSNYISPVCLPSSDFSFNGTQCITTGWNHRQSTYNRTLMGKYVSIYSSEYCISQTGFDSTRMNRYLCSHNNMEPSAVFNGESGGPLVCSNNGRSTLVGVVARSINGARATNIRLYSRVDTFLDWINSTINQN